MGYPSSNGGAIHISSSVSTILCPRKKKKNQNTFGPGHVFHLIFNLESNLKKNVTHMFLIYLNHKNIGYWELFYVKMASEIFLNKLS
jgi:hypothetical protein